MDESRSLKASANEPGVPPEGPMPEGLRMGHWSDLQGRTGCTVVMAPDGAVGGVDVRGAAASTLGTDSLRPGTLVDGVHGILLTGGSAFGLAAAAGAMDYLAEHDIGYELVSVRVPIVAGAVIFDLPNGDARARPDREAGYAACVDASRREGGGQMEMGAVGAGTGATVAKGGDGSQTRPGGLGIASARVAGARVWAVMVVNAVGGIWDEDANEWVAPLDAWDGECGLVAGANTTIGAVGTDARLSKEQANRLATVAHDGIARAIRPSHTMYDGDTIFALATGRTDAAYDAVEAQAVEVVRRAIVEGVRAGQ
ncbi:MAG TPA: P1 family peptidase [Solirubrobacteraceae bacterium]|nr:P1 family peptidase [Solirubrobacteraceae bacterium]